MGEARIRKMKAIKAQREFHGSPEKKVFEAIVERLKDNNPSVMMKIVSSKDFMFEQPYTVFVREVCIRGAVIQIRIVSYHMDNGDLVNVENQIIDRIDGFAAKVRDGEISECSARVMSQYREKMPWLWLDSERTHFYWTNTRRKPYPFDIFAQLVELQGALRNEVEHLWSNRPRGELWEENSSS